jgi:hypothetical protein
LIPDFRELLQCVRYRDICEIQATAKPLSHDLAYGAPALASANADHGTINH